MEMDLEGMSNKELREKCVEYGLPNVPITETSRKLMERRLKAAISGKPLANSSTPGKGTNRRETIHVTKEAIKSPSIITPGKNTDNMTKTPSKDMRTTRRTIAAMEKAISTTSTTNYVKASNIIPERTILHQPPEQSQSQQVIQKTSVKQTLYPQLPAKEPSPQAVHLKKSEILTTSYIQEPKQRSNTPLNSIYASAEEINSTDIHSKISPEKSANTPTLGSYGIKLSREPLFQKTIDLVDSQKKTSMPKPMTYNYDSKIGTLSMAARSTPGGYDTKLGSHLIGAGSSFGGSLFNKTQQQKRNTSKYHKTYADQYEYDYDDDNSWEEGEIFEDDTDDDINDGSLGRDIQTPYLSEFTRNLKSLKATPLTNKSNISSTINYSSNELNRRNPIHIAPRRTFQNPPNRNDITFRQFFMALEEKYHLKQTFVIIAAFSLAIFVYVVFLQPA